MESSHRNAVGALHKSCGGIKISVSNPWTFQYLVSHATRRVNRLMRVRIFDNVRMRRGSVENVSRIAARRNVLRRRCDSDVDPRRPTDDWLAASGGSRRGAGPQFHQRMHSQTQMPRRHVREHVSQLLLARTPRREPSGSSAARMRFVRKSHGFRPAIFRSARSRWRIYIRERSARPILLHNECRSSHEIVTHTCLWQDVR